MFLPHPMRYEFRSGVLLCMMIGFRLYISCLAVDYQVLVDIDGAQGEHVANQCHIALVVSHWSQCAAPW